MINLGFFKMYKRPWNPRPLDDNSDLPRKPDGSFGNVYIIILGPIIVHGNSYREAWKHFWHCAKLILRDKIHG